MPLDVTFDPARPLYVVTGSVEVTGDELVAVQKALLSDERIPAGCPGLLDFRKTERLQLTAEVVSGLVERAEEAVDDVGPSRVAIVTSTPSAYGLMRMYEILAEEGPHTIFVSQDYAEAERWLAKE